MTMLALCLLAVLSSEVSQQPAAAQSPVATVTGAFFALSVPDARVSARWYTEKLGLSIVMEDSSSPKTIAIVLEGGGLIVELIQSAGTMPDKLAGAAKSELPPRGFFKGGAIVADFDRTLAALRARDVEIAYGPFPARANQRANVIIRDNAGNLIQLFGGYAR
jgi:catechol 2,3-dioxygenase-like lactoylglutathione lyase family enzyme